MPSLEPTLCGTPGRDVDAGALLGVEHLIAELEFAAAVDHLVRSGLQRGFSLFGTDIHHHDVLVPHRTQHRDCVKAQASGAFEREIPPVEIKSRKGV